MGMCGSCIYFEWNKEKEQWFCNLSDSTGYQKYTMDNMVCHSKKNGREGYQLVPDTGGISLIGDNAPRLYNHKQVK